MSNGWSLFIIVLVVAHILGYLWLLFSTSRLKQQDQKEGETTGHVWDDDLREYNNPLPRWWLYLFILTIVFAIVYLVLYPGLGNYKGTLGWTQLGQWEKETTEITEKRNELYSTFISKSVEDIAKDPKAMEVGESLFANHCSTCHGSDAQGALGFPNLTDNDWLYGGSPSQIVQTITTGRNGLMPPWGAALGDEGVSQVSAYVQSFTDDTQDPELVAEGKTKFGMFCVACHGADAKGNQALGAPNLTDNVFLHYYDEVGLETILREGVQAKMPAHSEILDENNIKILSAYVYSIAND